MPGLLEGLNPRWGVYDPRRIGWPVPAARPVPFSWRGIPFPGGVANDDMVVVFTAILDDLAAEAGYHVQPDRDDWGGQDRPVTGGTLPSFHASRTAIDIDALENPYVKDGSWRQHTIPARMGAICRRYGCEWGGEWTSPKDYMHVQNHLTPGETKILADRIRALPPKETDMPLTQDDGNVLWAAVSPYTGEIETHPIATWIGLAAYRGANVDAEVGRLRAEVQAARADIAKVTTPTFDYAQLAAAILPAILPGIGAAVAEAVADETAKRMAD